jgi:hypothetical protein
MSHGGYPCPQQAHESPTQAPETEQEERDDKRDRRHGSRVRDQVAWIPRQEAHQEGDEIVGRSSTHSCQKAKPTADSDPAYHKTSDEADEETEHAGEEFQRRQSQCRLDGQPVHGDLQACVTERSRTDENDQDGEQGREHPCNGSGYQRRGETSPGQGKGHGSGMAGARSALLGSDPF